jgi:hypothetical protein
MIIHMPRGEEAGRRRRLDRSLVEDVADLEGVEKTLDLFMHTSYVRYRPIYRMKRWLETTGSEIVS